MFAFPISRGPAALAASALLALAAPASAFDTSVFYKLSTDFRGPNMCLDVHNGGGLDNFTHLVPCANYSGQYWALIPTGRPAN